MLITKGEYEFLRRWVDNITQEEAATEAGRTLRDQKDLEKSQEPYEGKLPRGLIGDGWRCRLARRRSGLKLPEAAALMKVSHVTLLAKEQSRDEVKSDDPATEGLGRVLRFWARYKNGKFLP